MLKNEIWYFTAENYWWLKGRRDLIYRVIKQLKRRRLKILDIGCSCGNLIEVIEKKKLGNVFGIDNSKYAVQKCIERGLNVRLEDASKLPYKSNFFDIVIASDVMEHIKLDKDALKEWKRVLKNNGYLILGVPAFNFLWSYSDYVKGHKRRYEKNDLIRLVKNLNLKILYITYWNFFIFIPISIIKIFLKNNKTNYEKMLIPRFINILFFLLLKVENILIIKYKMKFPFGISIFGIFKK
jgi:SAM-dependent methyltransferase